MYTKQQNVNVTNNVETNITNNNTNEKSATVSNGTSKPRVAQQLKAKVADAMARQSTEANNNLDTKAGAENEEYIYRGPKNTTGIFKNSLVLSDLTGFIHEPDKHPGADKVVHETFDAGTQTIVYEDSKVLDVVG